MSDYTDKVRADHYLHWLAVIGVGLYSWQIHGVLIGLVVFVAVLAAIMVTNTALIATTGSLRLVRISRWGWVVAAAIGVAISGAKVCAVGSLC